MKLFDLFVCLSVLPVCWLVCVAWFVVLELGLGPSVFQKILAGTPLFRGRLAETLRERFVFWGDFLVKS